MNIDVPHKSATPMKMNKAKMLGTKFYNKTQLILRHMAD
jgi:hypothetical protein